jgi:hypothetical protein
MPDTWSFRKALHPAGPRDNAVVSAKERKWCRLLRLEETVKEREQLAEGLHLIDFEQLKIENQSLTEKIEERNEEILKLKRKITTTVQVRHVAGLCHRVVHASRQF